MLNTYVPQTDKEVDDFFAKKFSETLSDFQVPGDSEAVALLRQMFYSGIDAAAELTSLQESAQNEEPKTLDEMLAEPPGSLGERIDALRERLDVAPMSDDEALTYDNLLDGL